MIWCATASPCRRTRRARDVLDGGAGVEAVYFVPEKGEIKTAGLRPFATLDQNARARSLVGHK